MSLNLKLITDDEELWGQFTDIEHGYSFQEQKIIYFSKPKIKTSPLPIPSPLLKTIPILIPSLKPCVINNTMLPYTATLVPYITEQSYENKNEKDDFYNPAFNKIIERQIYLGCIICILTVFHLYI